MFRLFLLILVFALSGVASAQDGPYDPLPQKFADMNTYDQIAMEPYRDRYDDMPLVEKADVYSRQFESMRNRRPNFEPGLMGMLDAYQSGKSSTSAYDAKKFMYKPATPKKPAPTRQQAPAGELAGLSGPWESGTPTQSQSASPPPPAEDGVRMENLRQGWNAMDVLRGNRKR